MQYYIFEEQTLSSLNQIYFWLLAYIARCNLEFDYSMHYVATT